jgi:hypothetical protein
MPAVMGAPRVSAYSACSPHEGATDAHIPCSWARSATVLVSTLGLLDFCYP